MRPRTVLLIRLLGLAIAASAFASTPYVISKLYTGRGADSPLRSALLEQPLVLLLGLGALAFGLVLAVYAPRLHAARYWLNPLWVWRNRRAELALLALATLLSLAALESASRALFAYQFRFPFLHSTEQLIYPPLYEQFHDYTDNGVNLLLLGGSVLYFAGREGRLESAFDPPARVYNLAQTAHSSLDSLVKFRYALDKGYRFDYAIFYHGINEVRANNVPPELFSPDYNHYFFYRLVNTVFGDRKPWLRLALKSSLFYRAYILLMQLRQTRLGGRDYVHLAFPREDWLQYGGDIRSKDSFRRNLEAIIALAEQHNIRLIVPRFAYDPVLDAWADGAPGAPSEADMRRYTEQWGLPQHVLAGIKAHNEVIHQLRDQFHYIDTTPLQRREFFVDPCHFSPQGTDVFLNLLAHGLNPAATGQISPAKP